MIQARNKNKAAVDQQVIDQQVIDHLKLHNRNWVEVKSLQPVNINSCLLERPLLDDITLGVIFIAQARVTLCFFQVYQPEKVMFNSFHVRMTAY